MAIRNLNCRWKQKLESDDDNLLLDCDFLNFLQTFCVDSHIFRNHLFSINVFKKYYIFFNVLKFTKSWKLNLLIIFILKNFTQNQL